MASKATRKEAVVQEKASDPPDVFAAIMDLKTQLTSLEGRMVETIDGFANNRRDYRQETQRNS